MFKQLHFYGGVHPDERKLTNEMPIKIPPLLEKYIVPLQQHIGAPAKPVVEKGAHVLKGDLLAEAGGFVSARIHSPTSGTVSALTTCLGPAGTRLDAIEITSDGEDTPCEPMPILDPANSSPADLKKRVQDAGIIGMGGAGFPTHVKLSPTKPVDVLILNGVECEPGLTSDHRLMLERPDDVLAGARAAATILGIKRIMLAIEANKPDAVKLMQEKSSRYGIEVHRLKVVYPQGAEKQLIYALTGRKVPAGGLPMDIGCVVQNVGTAAAIGEAVTKGLSSYERITTVTGKPLASPGNWRMKIGTTYARAIQFAGGVTEDPAKIISGGPMMGMSVYSLDTPILKNTSGILLLAESELYEYEAHPCIRCGRCNDNCPMAMMPGILSVQIENQRFELAEEWHVTDCIECGCCSYGCPAHRPLVQHMRRAKGEILARRKAQQAAAQKPAPSPAPAPAAAPAAPAK